MLHDYEYLIEFIKWYIGITIVVVLVGGEIQRYKSERNK